MRTATPLRLTAPTTGRNFTTTPSAETLPRAGTSPKVPVGEVVLKAAVPADGEAEMTVGEQCCSPLWPCCSLSDAQAEGLTMTPRACPEYSTDGAVCRPRFGFDRRTPLPLVPSCACCGCVLIRSSERWMVCARGCGGLVSVPHEQFVEERAEAEALAFEERLSALTTVHLVPRSA